jgi:hypothetical protein
MTLSQGLECVVDLYRCSGLTVGEISGELGELREHHQGRQEDVGELGRGRV